MNKENMGFIGTDSLNVVKDLYIQRDLLDNRSFKNIQEDIDMAVNDELEFLDDPEDPNELAEVRAEIEQSYSDQIQAIRQQIDNEMIQTKEQLQRCVTFLNTLPEAQKQHVLAAFQEHPQLVFDHFTSNNNGVFHDPEGFLVFQNSVLSNVEAPILEDQIDTNISFGAVDSVVHDKYRDVQVEQRDRLEQEKTLIQQEIITELQSQECYNVFIQKQFDSEGLQKFFLDKHVELEDATADILQEGGQLHEAYTNFVYEYVIEKKRDDLIRIAREQDLTEFGESSETNPDSRTSRLMTMFDSYSQTTQQLNEVQQSLGEEIEDPFKYVDSFIAEVQRSNTESLMNSEKGKQLANDLADGQDVDFEPQEDGSYVTEYNGTYISITTENGEPRVTSRLSNGDVYVFSNHDTTVESIHEFVQNYEAMNLSLFPAHQLDNMLEVYCSKMPNLPRFNLEDGLASGNTKESGYLKRFISGICGVESYSVGDGSDEIFEGLSRNDIRARLGEAGVLPRQGILNMGVVSMAVFEKGFDEIFPAGSQETVENTSSTEN